MTREPAADLFNPASFDSPLVEALAPPLVGGLAVLFTLSPFGFFLEGFHVWVHEFGHASAAWLSGRWALPLPFGWTNVEPEKSAFVYVGLPLLFATMAFFGWRERKVWPVVLGVVLLAVQTWMTWSVPESISHKWMIFAGVGGEFYLAAAMVGMFFFEFPDGFRWGACRYGFLFIGSSCFFESYSFWYKVKRGLEGIPYGSMINGEDDGGGDMNILKDDYGWTQHHIIAAYYHLANGCLLALLVVYLVFNFRLDRVFDRALARIYAA
jgi:hypothetical protein